MISHEIPGSDTRLRSSLGKPHYKSYSLKERAINEVVNALKPSQSSKSDEWLPPLRVANGLSTANSSALTTAAQENFGTSPLDGLPRLPGNSTIRWTGGLKAHPEEDIVSDNQTLQPVQAPPRKSIIPSLSALERLCPLRSTSGIFIFLLR